MIRPGPPPDSSDASLERIDKYTAAIFSVLTKPESSQFYEYFKSVSEVNALELANKLAHEMAFFPSLNGLVSSTVLARRGPRPRTDQAIFLAQIKQVLEGYEVKMPAWVNARESNDDLLKFCSLLAELTSTRGVNISLRTVAKAPKKGFST